MAVTVAVALTAAVDNSGPGTQVALTFTGGSVNLGGSPADGRYTLTILANQFGRVGFDGNGNGWPGNDYVLAGGPGATPRLFRFFGDVDGDGDVDSIPAFLGTYNAAFDFDNDGDVDAVDFLRFVVRYLIGSL